MSKTNFPIPPTIFEPYHDITKPLKYSKVKEEAQASQHLQPFKVDLSVTLLESSQIIFCKDSISPKTTPSKTKSYQWKKVLKYIKLDDPEKK